MPERLRRSRKKNPQRRKSPNHFRFVSGNGFYETQVSHVRTLMTVACSFDNQLECYRNSAARALIAARQMSVVRGGNVQPFP